MLKPDGSVLVGGFVIQDFIKFYEVADTVRFENTGNVPVKFTVFRNNLIDTLEVGQLSFWDLDRLPTLGLRAAVSLEMLQGSLLIVMATPMSIYGG